MIHMVAWLSIMILVCVWNMKGWFMSAMSENVGDKDQEPIIAWVA